MAAGSGHATSPGANSTPRLLCLPGAGASAARFERLRPCLNDVVDLRTFELPGRGIRFAEPPLRVLTDHVTHFVERIEAEPYQRWILLGESLGALTAAWLCRELSDSARAEVSGLITVAAAPKVTGRRTRDEVVELLSADARGLGPDSRLAIAMDGVLVDIDAAHAAGRAVVPRGVDVPMVTIRGSNDGLISEDATGHWAALAGRGWRYHEVPGNHYLFEEPTPELIEALRSAIGFVNGSDGNGPR